MRRIVQISLLATVFLGGCAADQLTENSLRTIDTFGSVERRLVLSNLARFVDDPYAIPGHADFTSGVFQSATTVGLSGRFPLMNLSSQAREIDLAMAGSTDTDNWTLTPVTDAQDLRRLRAVYSYAVCGDPARLEADWAVASGAPLPTSAARNLGGPPPNRWSVFAPPKDPSTPPKAATKGSVPQPGKKPGGGGVATGGDPSPGLARLVALRQVLDLLPRGRQWLYWTGGPRGQLPGEPDCPFPADAPPPAGSVSLGTYGGRELWTTDRRALSDFVLVVLASLPNTVGYPAVVGLGGAGALPLPKTTLSNPLGRIGTIR